MRGYFEKMTPLGRGLQESDRQQNAANAQEIAKVEQEVAMAVERRKETGLPTEKIHKRGEKTAWERLEQLVDPGTFQPLNSLYDPEFNQEGTTGVVSGIGQISGRYASIIASDNKVLAGAWIPGQREHVFRAQDIAERLRIPLVWVLNCSGVKLTEQEKVYAGRRSGGRTFFRHSELIQKGIPVIVGMYGTNPAGGGYHAISPAIIFAHEKSNMAVGGGGIVSGMSPKGGFDLEGAEMIIEATRKFKQVPPGSIKIHHDQTGFMRKVFNTEEGVLGALRECMAGMPQYDPSHFRVADPADPMYPADELNYIVPINQKRTYSIEQVLARVFDGSEHMEYRPDYGPEVYCGLAKIDGFLVGVIANRQGFLGKGYPRYAENQYMGIGGKLYREGLIKMNELVMFCGRDRIPMIWFQDTSGIDVGDIAERAELLGLGQALIYSIESSKLPMLCVVLRKGTAAAHYIMGGPQATRNNAFTLGVPTTEIYVMHGETASVAAFARRLVKEQDAGNPLEPVIDKMNALAQQYHDQSRPIYCAKTGLVDEIIPMAGIRDYFIAFTRCCYQNPQSVCPHHQMLLPRSIRG
ncbi:MAG: glutaconyl-CoA decarboxylase subunit alpha [Deltaproteobacteria bacterium]|nr:glutaconyl-CoA decarboxylase subunit alpha [Deltaproteobacteria bacterium]RLB28506.1 MAG: glutaconyl-CoA decarboxylase subunit alpha [Deltaproteobacteria bacterium]